MNIVIFMGRAMREAPAWWQESLQIRLVGKFRSFSCRGILISPASDVLPASKRTYRIAAL